jgi:hypothetical protein
MRKLLWSLAAGAVVIVLMAPRAQANVVALYAAGEGGVQNAGENTPGLGLELGARVLILDGYVDYTAFGQNESVARAILGLRGGVGAKDVRLVLRTGLGALREEHGALRGTADAPASRIGGVARAGAGIDARLDKLLYLGVMIDAEAFVFPGSETVPLGNTSVPASAQWGADVFAALKLTFELGI